jgi:molybdate transport system substrate-binding protein
MTLKQSLSALLTAGVLMTTACSDATGSDVLLVSAAASLTDAFNGIALAYEAEQAGVDIELNLAGSSTLREQALNGAPADVLVTANLETMAPVVDAGLAVGNPIVFARNRMTIAVPKGNLAGVTGLSDFNDPALLLGLCAEPVPCGSLARHILERAGITPAIDTNEPDVRSLLTKLEADELDAGIVYLTDVIASGDSVEAIAISDDVNLATEYPIVVLQSASDPEKARSFVEFVRSERGRAILARHGFELP